MIYQYGRLRRVIGSLGGQFFWCIRIDSVSLLGCSLFVSLPRCSRDRPQSVSKASQSFPRASPELPRASPEVHRASPELSRASSKHAQSSPERWGSTCWRPSIRIYSIRIYIYTHAQTYTYYMYRCMYRLIYIDRSK